MHNIQLQLTHHEQQAHEQALEEMKSNHFSIEQVAQSFKNKKHHIILSFKNLNDIYYYGYLVRMKQVEVLNDTLFNTSELE